MNLRASLIIYGLIQFMNVFQTDGSTEKILLRIGLLHDTKNEYIAAGIEGEINDYTMRYNISELYEIVAIKFNYATTEPGSLTESNLSAVFVASSNFSCNDYETVFSVMPLFYVTGSSGSCDTNHAYNRIIYMYPSHSMVNSAMLETMLQYNWKSATVLYQSNDEIQFSFKDMQDAGARGIDVSAYVVVGNDDEIKQKLIGARKKGYRTFVFVCSYTSLVSLMRIARELRLSSSNNHWFIPNVMVNPQDLEEFLEDGVKITSLHSPLVTNLATKVVQSNSSLVHDAQGLYKSVIMALSRIAIRALVESCDKTKADHEFYNAEDGKCLSPMAFGDNLYAFCGPDSLQNLTAVNDTGMDTTTQYNASSGTDSNNQIERVEFQESCIVYKINDTDVPASLINNSTNGTVAATSGQTRAVERATSKIGAHNQHQLTFAAVFDPCVYSSVYSWLYVNNTCSETFFNSWSLVDSNPIFVIEHFQTTKDNTHYHEMLAVGGYNGGRHQLSVVYPPFKNWYIQLPQRDFDVCVIWNPPWLSWDYDPVSREPVPNSYKGFLLDVLVQLSKSMGFGYVMNNASAVEFAEGFNHTTELMEARMSTLFDSDVCDIFLAAKRIHGGRLMTDDGMGLSKGFQQPKLYLMTKRTEKNENVSIWQFLTPFKVESWVILYASLLLVSIYMTYLNKKNPNEFRRAARELREGAEHSEHMGIMNSLWFNYAVLVQQGSQLLPKSLSMKVVSGTWWFFVLLVVSAYTASMISFMTQADNEGITTVDELVGQQEFDYGMVETNPLLTKLLPQARNAPYSTMWEQLKRKYDSSIFPDIASGLDKVTGEDLILIATFQETVRSIAESCDYDRVGDGFYEYEYGLPVRQGWQYMTMLNDHISTIYDDGILADLEEKWFGNLESACEKTEEGVTVAGQLDLKAFIGMYVFLSLGVTGGIVVCIFETVYVKYGGFGGITGRAKKYEFRQDHIEHQRPEKMMIKEFENWPGGWEVIKHRPFVSTISELIGSSVRSQSTSVPPSRAASSTMLINRRSRGDNAGCCPGCGQ